MIEDIGNRGSEYAVNAFPTAPIFLRARMTWCSAREYNGCGDVELISKGGSLFLVVLAFNSYR